MIQELVIFIVIGLTIYFIARKVSKMVEVKDKIILTKPNANKIDEENIEFVFNVASALLSSATENSITDDIFKNLQDNQAEEFIKFLLRFPAKFNKASADVLEKLTDAQALIWLKYRYIIKIIARKDIKEEVCTIFLTIDKFSTQYEYKIIVDKNGSIN